MQRAINARFEHLLYVALEAEIRGKIGRKVVFTLHLAARTEERLEYHPQRLREARGGVFHFRRELLLAASPGRADACSRPTPEKRPDRKRNGQIGRASCRARGS